MYLLARLIPFVLHCTLLWCCSVLSVAAQTSPVAIPHPPNIILIVADDMGWNDVGYTGNAWFETPTLDRLAHEGITFTQGYAAAPNCAPSRAVLMSGLYAPRHELFTMMESNFGEAALQKVIPPRTRVILRHEFVTIAEVLKQRGYATASIGKWNLGGPGIGPEVQGFDLNIAGSRLGHAHKGYWYPWDLPGLEQGKPGEYLTDRLTVEAQSFILAHREQPFFIYLAEFAPHPPYQAEEHLIEKYRSKKLPAEYSERYLAIEDPAIYAAMIENLDTNIGRLLQTLEQAQLADNTLIIFTSDNGGSNGLSHNHPLRGGKSMLYEGGIRVPLVAWWKGRVAQPLVVNEPVSGVDIFPTLLDVVGRSAQDPALDGESFAGLFSTDQMSAEKKFARQQPLFWYFPAYVAPYDRDATDALFTQRPVMVMRNGEWKLLQFLDDDHLELYDLQHDIGERHNLADSEPARRDAMLATLMRWRHAMQVDQPLPANPAYDPVYAARYQKINTGNPNAVVRWLRELIY